MIFSALRFFPMAFSNEVSEVSNSFQTLLTESFKIPSLGKSRKKLKYGKETKTSISFPLFLRRQINSKRFEVDSDRTWDTLQPVNHGPGKRRSVSKLTDKDILNDKVGQYNLTTQGQDTDGELETKVYKVRNEESVSTCIAFLKPSMNPKIPVRGPGFQDSGLGPRGSIVGSVVLAAPKFVMKYFCKMPM